MTAHRAPLAGAGEVTILVGGTRVAARRGESVAAALMAAGRLALRRSPGKGAPRGAFCLMGVCQECTMRIDGTTRPACMTEVREGMVVEAPA